jgi:hypothetical protein
MVVLITNEEKRELALSLVCQRWDLLITCQGVQEKEENLNLKANFPSWAR